MELINQSTMCVTWRGEINEAAVWAMHDFAAACDEEFGAGVVRNCLVRATEGGGIDRGGRKAFRIIADRPLERVAFVGARYELRVLMELLSKALNLLRLDTAKMKFVDLEAEALAWFAALDERDSA